MGRPLSIVEDVAAFEAARLLGLQVAPAGAIGYVALRGADRVHVKGRILQARRPGGQRPLSVNLAREWDVMMLVLMDAGFTPFAIWEAPRAAIEALLRDQGSQHLRGALHLARFKTIGRAVWKP